MLLVVGSLTLPTDVFEQWIWEQIWPDWPVSTFHSKCIWFLQNPTIIAADSEDSDQADTNLQCSQ